MNTVYVDVVSLFECFDYVDATVLSLGVGGVTEMFDS